MALKSLLHKFEFSSMPANTLFGSVGLARTAVFFFLGCTGNLMAQEIQLRGVVSDSIGPLGFANVIAMDSESGNLAAYSITINEGRKLLSIYPHPALPPAIALLSLVLGLNLLADGLREESLKD